ncbi:MAG: carbohydrate ABC transporter permease [Limnoraphis robusta]|jgi:multiple sugar transport system permease protein|uniref:Sugar ABC transporter n=2 Tax=Limnoraphis robusta TaxID=1118279 RepID=A0A0F5YL24_9CYAN|nr:carbohydrate ABC transporter permease [Limnoraphis robusta]KKD38885.1 sugar ABC transporter [Limnoraphis robusta CS-951]MEA5500901.1 carbohydrate ABC transporter permease [Limnoraphis robusta BA-68 BA1]MEA5521164.1 carbohydrate ABC transporter permease [Limnoraphis robusta CCNP1315]MEA5546686.1 carbohydrate ABC transporter permease [Limnoraphis robusta CCNP1324]
MANISKSDTSATPTDINWKNILLFIGVIFTVIFCLAPILWQILTSFKTNEAIAAIPAIYFPKFNQLTLEHYLNLGSPFIGYILNSAFVSLTSTLFCLAIGAPAAYTLARLRIPGENIILGFILLVTLFPYVLLFLGLLEVVKFLGLGNNYLALIIPYTAINLPLTILVLRSFFQQLPKDLEDSAKIDGYNTISMLLQIVLPMTTPALITTGILTFIFAWNEFIFALTFITRENLYTIPVAVAQLGGASVYEIPYGPIAAATIAGTFPLILLVLLFQRRIVQGITAGAVKG